MVNSGVSQGRLLRSCLTILENEKQFRDVHSLKFLAVKFQENPDVGTFAQGPFIEIDRKLRKLWQI